MLAHAQDLTSRRTLEALVDPTEEPRVFWKSYWAERPPYDRGDVTAHQYWTEVGRRLGWAIPADVSDQLVAADVESWSRIDHAMVGLVQQLRGQGRELALLSNAPVEIAGRIRKTQPWLTLFDATLFACDIGAAKPEPAACAPSRQS